MLRSVNAAALAVSVAALLVAGLSALFTKGQRDDTRRQADVAEAADERLRLGWRLELIHEGLYVLRNTGWATARDIKVSGNGGITVGMADDAQERPFDLEPNQGVPIVVFMSDSKSRTELDITWTPAVRDRKTGEEKREAPRTWSEPLPGIPFWDPRRS